MKQAAAQDGLISPTRITIVSNSDLPYSPDDGLGNVLRWPAVVSQSIAVLSTYKTNGG